MQGSPQLRAGEAVMFVMARRKLGEKQSMLFPRRDFTRLLRRTSVWKSCRHHGSSVYRHLPGYKTRMQRCVPLRCRGRVPGSFSPEKCVVAGAVVSTRRFIMLLPSSALFPRYQQQQHVITAHSRGLRVLRTPETALPSAERRALSRSPDFAF